MRVEQVQSLALNVGVDHPDFGLDVSAKLPLSGVTGIFGPSGSGKTTLLRVIAGLEDSATGSVVFDGEAWLDDGTSVRVPAHMRGVGFVFQDAGLFSHLDVAGNLRFAADRAENSTVSFDEIVSIFDLQSLLSRTVDKLSGGEKQRVAIARTLLSHPRLLLLDEPLAALDAARKEEILPYLQALPERFNVPILYVSHAIDEISRLADRIVMLRGGRIEAIGTPGEVLGRFGMQDADMEAAAIIEATVIEQLPSLHLTRLDYRKQTLTVPEVAGGDAGETVRLYIRAGDVAIATSKPEGISFRNVLEGKIMDIEADESGPFAIVSVDIGGTVLRANLTRHAVDELELRKGREVFALLKTASFDRRSY